MPKLEVTKPSCEELTHWKRLWCWEGLGAGEEGDDRGWDSWMASLTQWIWVWVSSGSWWWTGRPGVLQLMGSQRVGHDWVTELNWTEQVGFTTDPAPTQRSQNLQYDFCDLELTPRGSESTISEMQASQQTPDSSRSINQLTTRSWEWGEVRIFWIATHSGVLSCSQGRGALTASWCLAGLHLHLS